MQSTFAVVNCKLNGFGISQVQMENEKLPTKPDNRVKKFKLPRKPLHLEEFVCCVQESAIVKHVATIHRLFDALADGLCR